MPRQQDQSRALGCWSAESRVLLAAAQRLTGLPDARAAHSGPEVWEGQDSPGRTVGQAPWSGWAERACRSVAVRRLTGLPDARAAHSGPGIWEGQDSPGRMAEQAP